MPRRLALSIAALTCLSLLPAGAAAATSPSLPSPPPAATGVAAAPGTTVGTLDVTVGDSFATGESLTTAVVHGEDGAVEVPADLADGLAAGSTVEVTTAPDGDVAGLQQVAGAPVVSGVPDSGDHSFVFVPVQWSGATATPITQASMSSLISATNSYYDTISTHRIALKTPTVLGTVTITKPANLTNEAACGANEAYNYLSAKNVAAIKGAATGRRSHIIVVMPDVPGCDFAGFGSLSAQTSDGRPHIWLFGASSLNLRVFAHELGHNFGLTHSDSLDCTLPTAKASLPYSSCYTTYEDPWDLMGGAYFAATNGTQVGYLSAPNLNRLGLLPAGDRATVATTTSSAYRLKPVSAGTGLRLLTIPYGTRTYTVEYRAAVGLDSWITTSNGYRPAAGSGVVVRLRDRAIGEDAAVDFVPASPAPTALGNTTWKTPDGSIGFKVTSSDLTGATVVVTRSADKTPPTIAGADLWSYYKPKNVGDVITSSTIGVGWSAADDADSAITSVALVIDGKVRATGSAAAYTQLKAGVFKDGAHKWRIVMKDAFGNVRSTPERTVRIDTGKPKVTSSPRASLAKGTVSTKTIPVGVKWAATDGCGIVWNSVAGSNGLSKTFYGKPKTIPTRVKLGTNQFAVRVADCMYNYTGVSYGPKTKATLDKQSKRKGYHGTWTATKAKKALGGTEQVTKKKKAYVSYKVKARSIGWVATKGKDRGKAAVYVDGKKVAVVNLSAKKTTYAQQVFTKTWSKAGTHTIKIVNLTSKKVGVDAFTRLS